jgi:hypothetical protein
VILHLKELDWLTYCIIIELFVFELEGDLRKENSVYLYIKYILCCCCVSTTSFKALLAQLTKSFTKFLLRGRALLGLVQDRLSLTRDRNFKKRVCFDVVSKQDLVSLHLKEGDLESFNISSSPFSVN